jgi:hypothetical protein
MNLDTANHLNDIDPYLGANILPVSIMASNVPISITAPLSGSFPVQNQDATFIDATSHIKTSAISVTLPANMSGYTSGHTIVDISGNIGSIPNINKTGGYPVTVLGLRIQTTETNSLSGTTIRVHFYNQLVTGYTNNTAFVVSNSNYLAEEGSVDVTFGTGNSAKVGQVNNVNLSFCPTAQTAYIVLETLNGFIPTANSCVIYLFVKYQMNN